MERLSTITAQQKDLIGLADAGRWIKALHASAGNVTSAAKFFLTEWPRTLAAPLIQKGLDDVELLTKAPTSSGSTLAPAWAGALQRPAFLDPLSDAMIRDTVLSKIPGLVKGPLNVPIPYESAGPAMQWIPQGGPKPCSQLTLGSVTLPIAKGGTIEILTDELLKTSVNADLVVASRLVHASTKFVDSNFLDPALAAVPDKNPASITNGATNVAPGADADASIAALVAAFFAQRPYALAPSFVLSAAAVAKVGASGDHDGLSTTGGQLVGIPATIAAGGGNVVALLDAAGVYYNDAGAEIDYSRYATVAADTAPTSATELRDLWSRNELGVKVERWVTWGREDTAVAYVVLA